MEHVRVYHPYVGICDSVRFQGMVNKTTLSVFASSIVAYVGVVWFGETLIVSHNYDHYKAVVEAPRVSCDDISKISEIVGNHVTLENCAFGASTTVESSSNYDLTYKGAVVQKLNDKFTIITPSTGVKAGQVHLGTSILANLPLRKPSSLVGKAGVSTVDADGMTIKLNSDGSLITLQEIDLADGFSIFGHVTAHPTIAGAVMLHAISKDLLKDGASEFAVSGGDATAELHEVNAWELAFEKEGSYTSTVGHLVTAASAEAIAAPLVELAEKEAVNNSQLDLMNGFAIAVSIVSAFACIFHYYFSLVADKAQLLEKISFSVIVTGCLGLAMYYLPRVIFFYGNALIDADENNLLYLCVFLPPGLLFAIFAYKRHQDPHSAADYKEEAELGEEARLSRRERLSKAESFVFRPSLANVTPVPKAADTTTTAAMGEKEYTSEDLPPPVFISPDALPSVELPIEVVPVEKPVKVKIDPDCRDFYGI